MKNKLLKSKYLGRLLYILFFMLAFFVSFYMTFPVEDLKGRITSEIEAMTPFRAVIKDLSVGPIFSLKIHDLKLSESERHVFNIDELVIKPSLLGLIFSDKVKLPFEARFLGGETAGTLFYDVKTRGIEKADARLSGIDIKTIPSVIAGGTDRPRPSLEGVLNGNLYVELAPVTKGHFSFAINKLGIKHLRIKGFMLPEFVDMESRLAGSLEGEITKIDELRLNGENLDLILSGTTPILWRIEKGDKVDLWMRLQLMGPKQEIFRKFLASYLVPQGDGTLGAKIAGTFYNPRLIKDSTRSNGF